GDLASSTNQNITFNQPVFPPFVVSDAASVGTDTTTNFITNGFSQMQTCNQSGIGATLIGNYVGQTSNNCGLLSTSPYSKLTVMNNTNSHTELTLLHNSATGGTGVQMLRALSASLNTGLKMAYFCAGTTNADGACNGTELGSFNDYGSLDMVG